MSKTRGPRRVWKVLALGVAGLTLSGCSGLHPGVAVQVGDQTITIDKVDATSADFCEAVEPQLLDQAESIQHSYLRGGIAGTLAMRSIADQLADQYGVTADSDDYTTQLTEIRKNVATLPENLRESVIEVDAAPLYVEEIQAEIGKVVLGADGERQDLVAAGQKEFATWVDEHDVEFDPSLNSVMKDGSVANQDQAVSFAVSESAKNGLEQQPNSVLARQTPDSHRCGR